MLKYNPDSIKNLIEQFDMLPSEFAREVGASRQKVFNWTTLKQQPDAKMLMEIASKFNIPMSYFFVENDDYSGNQR